MDEGRLIPVEQSYAACVRIARQRARNFYYSFLLLPKQKRLSMCAVYAFMRVCDDLSDEPGATLEGLDRWRADLDRVLKGEEAAHELWPAFRHTVEQYRIPARYFHEMIDGVASDLQPRDILTFDDLYRYCYHVASVVGMTIIHIYGFEDPRALSLAEKCGIAFQLTNIIRDAGEDRALGRDYFPAEDRTRFGDEREMLRHYAARARIYYEEARPLLDLIHRDARRSLWAIMEIYRRLLDRIEERNYDVWSARVRLPAREKLWILAQSITH
jgi:phytoene synthase